MPDRKPTDEQVDPGEWPTRTSAELDRIAGIQPGDEEAILEDASVDARRLLEARETEEGNEGR